MSSEETLAQATVALAVATVLLVMAGAVTAWAALKQARIARDEGRSTRAAAARAQAANVGQATLAAFARFETIYSAEHEKLLATARAENTTVRELLRSSSNRDALVALQKQLDALEMLGLGARMRVFDVSIIHQAGRSVIDQLWDRSAPYRSDLVTGRLDSRPVQPSAYEHSAWLHDEMDKMGKGRVPLDGIPPPIG